jgi:hypothetical protein
MIHVGPSFVCTKFDIRGGFAIPQGGVRALAGWLSDQNLNIRAIAPVRLASDKGARQTSRSPARCPGLT